MAFQFNEETKNHKQNQKIGFLKSSQPKCSPKEIKEWIDKERINIDSLPNQLKMAIKEFLSVGYLDVEFNEVVGIYNEINNAIDVGGSIDFNINGVAKNLLANLEQRLGITFLKNKENTIKKEIYIYVRLKHDGVNHI